MRKQHHFFTIVSIGIFIFIGCDKKSPTNSEEATTVTDIDGNVYQTVKIGDQWWMAENLKVTHYRNGDPIPHVTDSTAWPNLITGAYCNYDNVENHVSTYGRLYNWYAASDSRNIAPEGWHVPTDEEWQALVDTLGRNSVAGGKLKEADTFLWAGPNTGATNESGFSALPAGYRRSNGEFQNIDRIASFWSSHANESILAWHRTLSYRRQDIRRVYYDEQYGFSVRCIKD